MVKRESNFELMRIISMFFIILFHVIYLNQELRYTSKFTSGVLDVILMVVLVHVNSFILLTGYFQCEKSFSWKKVFSILYQSWFYRIFALIIVLYFGLDVLSNLEIIQISFPLPLNHYHWFVHYYVLLYLLSPFLNQYFRNISSKDFRSFLCVLFFINSILPFFTNRLFYSNEFGMSLFQFVFLYSLGAYFRKFPIRESYHFKNITKKKFLLGLVFVFFFCVFLNSCAYFAGKYIGTFAIENTFPYEIGQILRRSRLSYDYPFTILQSCCYFLFFSCFSFQNSFLNRISRCMFGVYLIHESEILKYIFYDYLVIYANDSLAFCLYQIFLYSFLILVVCTFVEFIRQTLHKFLYGIYRKVR